MTPARLLEVTLPTADPAGLRVFYGALGVRTEPSGTLCVGPSRLTFVHDPAAPPSHFAFGIPFGALASACAWLDDRGVPRLAAPDGRTRFDFAAWRARAVYFRDPDGHIVELIERERRGVIWDGARPFDADHWLELSEFGLAVPDPAAAARRLEASTGLAPFPAGAVFESGTDFAAVGDDAGLLVLVRSGRPWFPDERVPATPVEARVRLRGGPSAWTALDGTAYRIGGATVTP